MQYTRKIVFIMFIIALFTAFLSVSTVYAEPNVADWLEEDGAGTEQAPEPVEPVVVKEEQNLFGIILKLVVYTVLILAMIYGLIKFLAIRQRKFQPNQAVQLMGGTPLGNNKSLQLVKVGEQVLLIGVGDQVTLIKEFANTDEIGLDRASDDMALQNFGNPLLKLSKWKKETDESRNNKTSRFEDLLAQSLNKQKDNQHQFKQILANKSENEEGNRL